ncbi:MAG: xanthine dehydrogenase family protein molybdopterin-binding subunit [Deltaproteobacteria bacterium]|nr:xanthine dehydrogenase family protein molybdopterin-binding subunit [Deltaproteobacteria bacterium]
MKSEGYIGKPHPGLKNTRLVSGKGRYVDDVRLAPMTYMAVHRSPHAHARILSIDDSEARRLPGVLDVVTGEEIKRQTNPLPTMLDTRAEGDKQALKLHALSADRVRFVGEAIAAVVAEDRYTARLAADRISVRYEPLPAVTDPEQGMQPDAPLVEPAWKDNVLIRRHHQHGDVAKAFEEAAGIAEGRVRLSRITSSPIEPRGYVAAYDPYNELLTFWASTQDPHPLRNFLADTIHLPENQIRVIQGDVGGAFGIKIPLFPEEVLIAYLSKKLKRAVKWIEDRTEHFQACGHARDVSFRYRAAFREDGGVTGLEIRIMADIGAASALLGWASAFATWLCLPGNYKIPDIKTELYAVVTNKCPWNAVRGFGKDAASYVMERIMDDVARRLGKDRAEIRFRNFLQPHEFPYRSPTGAMLDSGNYPEVLRRLLALVDYEKFRDYQQEERKNGRCIGLGIGMELMPEGVAQPGARVTAGFDGATVRVSPSGDVTVLTGVTSPGSGNETAIAQIVADTLGCDLKRVKVVQGDTEICPWGLGNHSARSVMYGGGAAKMAAEEIREKMKNFAARMMEVAPEDLEVQHGRIFVKGVRHRSVTFEEVALQAYRYAYRPDAVALEPALETTRYFRMGNVVHQPKGDEGFNAYPVWANGGAACIVEVDPETGLLKILRFCFVHDGGTLINPLLAEANLHGGLTQGVGNALYEQIVYDEAGQLLTGTFMDYTIPTCVEAPVYEIGHCETPSPFAPFGAKGIGESGIGATLNALTGAVEDAFPELSLRIDSLPLTPHRVWKAIQDAKGGR